MCFPLVVAALGHVCNYLSGFWCSSLWFNNNGILAKFWSVKYFNPSCWLKQKGILLLLVQCFLIYPFAFDPAFSIIFHAFFFWFCTIFSKEASWFFYFYCVLFHVSGLCVRISVENIVK